MNTTDNKPEQQTYASEGGGSPDAARLDPSDSVDAPPYDLAAADAGIAAADAAHAINPNGSTDGRNRLADALTQPSELSPFQALSEVCAEMMRFCDTVRAWSRDSTVPTSVFIDANRHVEAMLAITDRVSLGGAK